MMHEGSVAVPEPVIARLDLDIEQLTSATVARVLRDLDSYASVAPVALEVSVRRNLTIAVRALRTNRPPEPTELGEAEETTRERFARGIPVEEIIRAFRISIGLIQERFVATCFAEGVPADATLAGSRLLWAVGDAFTTRVITAYHALDLDSALQDAQRRTRYVRAMLQGRLNLAETAADLASYRVAPDASYAAVRGRIEPPSGERTRRALEASGGLPSRAALVAVDGDECVGIVARRPRELDHAVIGIGPFVPLREINDSFAIASRAFEAATALHDQGVFGIEDLSWRLAAVGAPEVSALLRQRYLDPLRSEGEFGAVLVETLRVYLHHGGNVARSAEALVTHANTLRYRLRRFTELTGRSLESTEVLVELAWALEVATAEDRSLRH
jgi:hypothetical protein